jgi:hypothetical protein
MKQFATWFTHGVPGGAKLRAAIYQARTGPEVLAQVELFFAVTYLRSKSTIAWQTMLVRAGLGFGRDDERRVLPRARLQYSSPVLAGLQPPSAQLQDSRRSANLAGRILRPARS